MADLDKGLALPVVSFPSVVAKGMRQTDGQLSLVPLRTQTQVNTKYWTFGRWTRKNFRNLLRHAHEVFAIGNARRRWFLAIAIEKQQVDIRTVVELIAA